MDSSTSAFRRTGDVQMPSWHFSVPVISSVHQQRNTWCAGITWYFYTCRLLGNCEHLFQSEPPCQIFLPLWCTVDFPQSKIFLVCSQWPKHGDFSAISTPRICSTGKESSCLPPISYYARGFVFTLIFSLQLQFLQPWQREFSFQLGL